MARSPFSAHAAFLFVAAALLAPPALLAPATPAAAAPALGDLLVSIESPPPGLAAEVQELGGLTVVRDLERYLLGFADAAAVNRLRADGLEVRVLADGAPERSFWTVTARTEAFLDAAPEARLLRFDGWDAVIDAEPAVAERIAESGWEIAKVFARPIRVREAVPSPDRGLSRVADPAIQTLVDAVDGTAITASVQRLQDFVTRYASHDSCLAASQWIKAEFVSFGIDSVFFHEFSSTYHDNVVAVIPGKSDPSKHVLIGGHYDSITSNHDVCPGADDDATGVAGVLECARILSGLDFEYTLVFVAFGGEELGLFGSEGYAADAAARGDDIVAAIAVDMIGYVAGGDTRDLDIIDNSSSIWLRDLAFSVAADYVPAFSLVDGALPGGASSDHASFWAQGYDAILFFEDTGSYSPYIHTANDVVGTSYNDPAMARYSTQTAVALLATIARPLTVGIVHDPLPDTEATSGSYAVDATIVSLAALEPDSLLVRWTTGGPMAEASLAPAGLPDEWTGSIPAQPGGTWVDYWLVAADTDGNRVTHPDGAPGAATHRFFVGTISAVALDECEAVGDWTVGYAGDAATTGIWEHGNPNGTLYNLALVQPEDDHTPSPGVACWVTGNQAGAAQGDDDVDGGVTTLVSPSYDLSPYSNARVRYHRWYSNDTGASPEADDWAVDVSTNGGSSWIRLETLSTSDRNWTLVEHDLGALVTLTSDVSFRFVAADTGLGSIIEAALDDFSIVTYQDPATLAPTLVGGALPITLARPYPNPFSDNTSIRLNVPGPARPTTVAVYGVGGRRIVRLLDGEPVTGSRVLVWDGRDARGGRVASGVYWVRLEVGDQRRTQRLVRLR